MRLGPCGNSLDNSGDWRITAAEMLLAITLYLIDIEAVTVRLDEARTYSREPLYLTFRPSLSRTGSV